MESIEDKQTDVGTTTVETMTKKKEHRGTRRQQRYRARQKLLQLCELASAQAAVAAQHNETEESITNNDLQMMEVTQVR